MSQQFPLEKLKHGMFFQLPSKESERTASRVFELYDKAANREISIKEVRNITRDIYSNLNLKKVLTDKELQAYYNQLDKLKDGKLKEDDFFALMNDYFVNPDKNGSLDISEANREIYSLCEKEDSEMKNSNEIASFLVKEGNRRFGNQFMESQLKECRVLFDESNTDKNQSIEFKEIFTMFEKLFKKIGIVDKKDKLDNEDVQRLLELMDFDVTGVISYDEFELFYLKGLLGS